MKKRRIKARKAIQPELGLRMYVILERDIEQIAEQLDRDYWKHANASTYPEELTVVSMLYALKRLGITPARGAK